MSHDRQRLTEWCGSIAIVIIWLDQLGPRHAEKDCSLAKRSLPDRACLPPVHVLAFKSKGRPVLFMKMNGL